MTIPDLRKSEVRSETDALLIVHHATRNEMFDPSDMAPLSHFGTRQAARQRIFDWPEARLISALLDIRNPLYLPDLNDNHDPERLARLIMSDAEASRRLGDDFPTSVIRAEEDAGEGAEEIVSRLKAAGYDGIGYRNLHEDPGSMSWIILDPSQVHVLRDGPAGSSLDPWELDVEGMTGNAIIMPFFEIDGRSEEFDHIWEALSELGDILPDLGRDAEGWSARWLTDWSPEASFGLFDQNGKARGFYMGGMAWIDECARGMGKSSLMVLAAADLLGGRPSGNHQGLGYSESGYQAHVSALRLAKALACENGYVDLEDGPGPV